MSPQGSPLAAPKRPYIGGQAVIEGVMMRSPRSLSVAVRRRAGTISLQEKRMPDPRKGVYAWPLIRGVATLVEALRLGFQALRFSADLYESDLDDDAPKPASPGITAVLCLARATLRTITTALVAIATSDLEPSAAPEKKKSTSSASNWIALPFALLLFVALPQAAATGVSKLFDMNVDIRSPAFQAITGVFKLFIVIGYMLVIRRIPEIRRVFMYHGAEHKAIAAYEANEPLETSFARTKSRFHPRCGTTFLVMVVFVSILVFSAIGPLLPKLPIGGLGENILFFLLKLPFLPVIAAITYEIQRFTARYCLTGPLRYVLYPGFAVQAITTSEPDDAQLEIALGSLRASLRWEEANETQLPTEGVRHFQDFPHLVNQSALSESESAEPTRGHHAAT